MNEHLWKRVKEVFHEAAALPTADRLEYVRRACGDDAALAEEVAELLASHAHARTDDLEPGGELAGASAADRDPTGTMIGPYKLLQRIGEGGFGVVYMAEQMQPVRRTVALKIIKLGMDTKQVIARFEAERQALALMDHPNIARVLDAGSTATGRPYFVMELVKGVPITEYCDANNLATRDRLELFVAVCHAVRHAHQKGVIHRDIKPSNVLVTLHDGVPVPKVIDFGIAKATGARLTDKTLFTEFKQFLGTPEYMSPEQAEMSGLDIDTRADIYSLGVLLYELLTGTTPFDARTLRQAAYDEILRIIRESEPERPSTRLSTLGDRLVDVARHRGAEPKALGRLLVGDLDWIVMKALEKDRTRRYESADGFAEDIQRYLRDEPVLASPPSAAYKVRKFARRHRAAIGALSAVVLALVLGLAAALNGLQRERMARNRAMVAREQALHAKHSAQREAQRAQKVNAFLRRFIAAPGVPWLSTPETRGNAFGPDVKVVQVVDEIEKSLGRELADEPEIEAEVRFAIGESYGALSRYADAEMQLRRALELHERISHGEDLVTMEVLRALSDAVGFQGRSDEAKTYLRRAIDGCRRLTGEHSKETLAAESSLVWFLMDKDDPEAEPLGRLVLEKSRELHGKEAPETLGARASLAFALNTAGKHREAEALARETIDIVRRTMGESVGLYHFLFIVLGNSALLRGDPVEAERLFRPTFERAQRNRQDDLFEGAISAGRLGEALAAQGRWAEAETLYRKASAASLRCFGGANPDTGASFAELARALSEQGKNDEAERVYRELVDLSARSLDAKRPERINASRLLARHLARTGKPAEAEPIARGVVEAYRELWNAGPTDGQAAGRLVRGLGTWGAVLSMLDRREAAEKCFREALDVCGRALGDEDADTLATLESFALLLDDQKRWAESEGLLRRILAVRSRTLGEEDPGTLLALNNLAWALSRLGRDAEAEPLARASVEGQRKTPNPLSSRTAVVLDTYGCVLKGLGRLAEAEAAFREIESLEPAGSNVSQNPEILLHHAEVLLALERPDEAAQRLRTAREILSAAGGGDSPVSRAVEERLADLEKSTASAGAK
jgi:serine/threonine protein kinase